MKKEVFIENTNEMGIDLEFFRIYVDSVCKAQYSLGGYFDGKHWVLYSVDERSYFSEDFRGDEDSVFDRLFNDMMIRLHELKYINHSITKDIVQIPRSVIFDYFCKKYQIDVAFRL